MKYAKATLLLVALMFIGGCGITVESLRSDAAGSITFTIARPLPDVFNIIAEQALGCNPGAVSNGPVPSQWYVKPAISQDRQTAEVQFFHRMPGIERHLMVIDLIALHSGETQVTSHYKYSPWRDAAENVEGWVKGTSHHCWVKG